MTQKSRAGLTYQVKKKGRRQKNQNPLYYVLAICLFLACVTLAVFVTLKVSEDGVYTIYDPQISNEPLGIVKHAWYARNQISGLSEEAYAQDENGKVTAIQCGLVMLNTKDISENTLYTQEDGSQGYLNGSFAYDGLYLQTKNHKIQAQISGMVGWFDEEDIELIPYSEDLAGSYYSVEEGLLMHTIAIDPSINSWVKVPLCQAPESLMEGNIYYSYDGNWFYSSLPSARQDLLQNSHSQAVNQEAFYNPWQYLPHHTLLDISTQDANALLDACIYDGANNSVLYNAWPIFAQVQAETGVSAAMMFALACNESAYGTSQLAWTNNNLFGHAVYDENPDAANAYNSLQDCIAWHAENIINAGYSNPADTRWHGSWFGNKESGMNVSYASDPYWGEKAASILFSLIKDLPVQVQTQKTTKEVPVYADKNKSSVLYTWPENCIFSTVIQEEDSGFFQVWYTVASEVKNDDSTWSGYIQKGDL